MIDFACKKFNIDDIVKCSLGLTKSDFRLLQYLIEHGDEYHRTEDLAEELNLNLSTVQRGVKKLTEQKMVLRSQENLDGGGYVFIYRIKKQEAMKKVILDIIDNWRAKVREELSSW